MTDDKKKMSFRHPHSAFRTRNAFTFVELIATVFVIGILTAAAVPSFVSSIMYHRVESAALRLKRDLELVRQTAVAKSMDYTLEFTTATVYKIANLDSLDRSGQDYTVDLAKSPHSVNVTSVDFGGSTSVTFNGYGVPTTDGTVIVRAGSHQRQIILDLQGHVSVSQ